MSNNIIDDFSHPQHQINELYKTIRASGILRMAHQLRLSSEIVAEQGAIMKNINDSMVAPYQKIAKSVTNTVPKSALSSFAKVNSILSGIPTKQLNQIFSYNQINSQLFKRIAEQQVQFSRRMAQLNEYLQEAQRHFDQKYRELEPVISCLKNCGWVITPFIEINELFKLKGKSRQFCNQFMTDYYTKNHYNRFYYEYGELIKDFTDDEELEVGYLEQLKLMRNLLKQDFNNSKVLISTAVSILDFKYVEKMGSINTNRITTHQEIVSYFDEHKNDERSVLDYLSFLSLLKVMDKFFQNGRFRVGIENTELTRHAIQHGRYDPNRLKNTDFIKVMLLIIAIRFSTDIDNID
jgi:hypothetical protein